MLIPLLQNLDFAGSEVVVAVITMGPPWEASFVDPARAVAWVDPDRTAEFVDPARSLEWH